MSDPATGHVVLAGNRQMQTGSQIGGLFLIVWGGMFAGIPLAIFFAPRGSRSDGGPAMLLVFMLVGVAAFCGGLYLVLVRREVLLDATRTRIVEVKSFLGSEQVTSHARQLFDHAYLGVEIGQKGAKSFPLELRGKGDANVSLGTFYERNEARSAGVRAARGAGLRFEERLESGGLLKLTPQQLEKVPMAKSPRDKPWWRTPSVLALVAANLVPVWGVLAGGWSILAVMLLFWLENVIIGLFTITKILLARGNAEGAGPAFALPLVLAGNLFIAAFFTVHYGMFCAGHGMFILSMFGDRALGSGRIPDVVELPRIVHDLLLRHGLLWAAIALVASHGISFVAHYLKPRAYEDAIAGKIMFDPYKRIVILHVVLIVGGFAATLVGTSVAPLLLLIALKIAVDLTAHRREHAVPYERELRDYLIVHANSEAVTTRTSGNN